MNHKKRIFVVIPCYRVRDQIIKVINDVLPYVDGVVVVDDCCPEHSGELVRSSLHDSKVRVLNNESNQGVGGSVLNGFNYAVEQGAEILLKIDGDGQMDVRLIPKFVEPIALGQAEYSKGNRFTNPEALRGMPVARLIGNAGLSFLTKASTGYWTLMDPTNGYLAIEASTFKQLPTNKISRRYFFESDVLFRLNFLGARVVQIPMQALYGDEKSSLSITRSFFEFGIKNIKNFFKRIVYSYFVLDFNMGSIALLFSLFMFTLGLSIGLYYWIPSILNGHLATSGQVMMAALPTLLAFQSLFFFFTLDIAGSQKRML